MSEMDDRLSVDCFESPEVPDDASLETNDVDSEHDREKAQFIHTQQEQFFRTDFSVFSDKFESIPWSEADEPTNIVTTAAGVQTTNIKLGNTESEHVDQFVNQRNNAADVEQRGNSTMFTSLTTSREHLHDTNSKDSFTECTDSTSYQCNDVSDFSDWSDSLQDAVNDSLIQESGVAFTSRTANNVASSATDVPSESPVSHRVTQSPKRLSTGGQWENETPKRHENEQVDSSEPPNSKPRLMSSREVEEWKVSPLRRTLNAKLSLT